jgi:16S rRNA (adenine1518-N6/adenine1519-N6)-dimethyltransferase
LPQKLGQHFLTRQSFLGRIAEAACATGPPLVIEIGGGKGALTAHLLERAARVVTIEVDPAMVSQLLVRFAGEKKLKVVAADVLATDLTQWGPGVVAGNLPYYITSPIIERVLAMGRTLTQAVFLIQKEVADRLAAKPGTRDYGFLTVATRLVAETKILFKVPPSAFQPPPNVYSAAVSLTPRPVLADPTPLIAFVGLCFKHKRKTLRNNLSGIFGRDLVEAQPEANLRAEQLTLDQFQGLYRRLTEP